MLRSLSVLAASAAASVVMALTAATSAAAGGYGDGYGYGAGYGYGSQCCGCVTLCAPPPPLVVWRTAPAEPMYVVNQGPVFYGPGITTLPAHVAPPPRVYPWVGYYPPYYSRPYVYPRYQRRWSRSAYRHIYRPHASHRMPLHPSQK